MENWAEIRRLRTAENLPIKVIARQTLALSRSQWWSGLRANHARVLSTPRRSREPQDANGPAC